MTCHDVACYVIIWYVMVWYVMIRHGMAAKEQLIGVIIIVIGHDHYDAIKRYAM